jgi:hypothetical protein
MLSLLERLRRPICLFLCFDTCSIPDIMRDPTRDNARTHERRAVIDLIGAAEQGSLHCPIADQVQTEFYAHDGNVQEETRRAIARLREQVERVNEISGVYGSLGISDLSHLEDHVERARASIDRLMSTSHPVVPGPTGHANAFARSNAARPPARQGKDSAKDCLVYETYLEAATNLRAGGLASPIVFLSSNTSDYLSPARILKEQIVLEFGAVTIDYAPNAAAAKHALKV